MTFPPFDYKTAWNTAQIQSKVPEKAAGPCLNVIFLAANDCITSQSEETTGHESLLANSRILILSNVDYMDNHAVANKLKSLNQNIRHILSNRDCP